MEEGNMVIRPVEGGMGIPHYNTIRIHLDFKRLLDHLCPQLIPL